MGNEWSESEVVVEEIRAHVQHMRDAGQISEAMAIKNFINPWEKDVDDSNEDIIDQIIAERALEPLKDPEKTFVEVSPIKLNEALQALATLKLYEEQQTSLSVDEAFKASCGELEAEGFEGLVRGGG